MVFVELGIEVLLFAHVDMRKMAPSRFSHSGTNIVQAMRKRHSTPRLRDPVQLLHGSIVLTDPLFDIHEAQGPFHTTSQKSMTNVSLHHVSQKLPQHEYKNRAIFFMRRRKASRKALFLQAIS